MADAIYDFVDTRGWKARTNNRQVAAQWCKEWGGKVSGDGGKTWWTWNGEKWQRVLI